jgi:Lrp/AsnC family transcriptional regulator for asnA, asnC and gidA
MDLDLVDRKILAALEIDARVSYTNLSKDLELSDVAVRKRIDKLLKDGIIRRFSVELDNKKLNRPFHAFMLIKCSPAEASDIKESIKITDNIHKIHSILGPYDILLEAYCRDVDELRRLSEEHIGNLPGVLEIRTLMVV